jgi:hypothetical protein
MDKNAQSFLLDLESLLFHKLNTIMVQVINVYQAMDIQIMVENVLIQKYIVNLLELGLNLLVLVNLIK